MTPEEALLKRAADEGGILVHGWSLLEHGKLVAAIRAVLEERQMAARELDRLAQEKERLRATLAQSCADARPDMQACPEVYKLEARIEAALAICKRVEQYPQPYYALAQSIVKALRGEE